jgi:EpsI family protein
MMFASLVLLGQIGIYYSVAMRETTPTIPAWDEFSRKIRDWDTVAEFPLESEVLAALSPDDYLSRNYASSEQHAVVNLAVVSFNTRRSGHAPHSPTWCLPGAGWKEVSSRVVRLRLADGATGPAVNEYVIQKDGERQIVVYWYHQGGRVVANETMAQLFAMPDMILHRRTDTALVRISSPALRGDLDRARQTVFQFAAEAFPLIQDRIR